MSRAGKVATAIRSKSGKIYMGMHRHLLLDWNPRRTERDFQHDYIGEHEIDNVLCLMPDGSTGAPCGVCRKFMVQIMPGTYRDIEIMFDCKTARTAKLGDLPPEWLIG